MHFLVLTAALFALTLGAPLQAQTAGQLISAQAVHDAPAGMQAWRIRYWTRSETSQPIQATGMVVVPSGPPPHVERDIVAWAHGTSGVAEKCALSTNPDFWKVTPGLSQMIAAGYVVVAPDYPGLGSPIQHAYLVGRETAHSVIDAVRAARRIPATHAGRDLVVWGESQGGFAALWTASIMRQYGRDLDLKGTAAIAPPTNLLENLRLASDKNVKAMLMAFLSYSWSERLGAPLGELFNSINRGVVRRLAQNNCVTLDASPKLGTIAGILSVRHSIRNLDLASKPEWARLARHNSVSTRKVHGPVFIAQSVEDPIVSPQVTVEYARKLCRRGERVDYLSLPGGDHARSGMNSAAEALAWIADRFAGKPAPNNCGRF